MSNRQILFFMFLAFSFELCGVYPSFVVFRAGFGDVPALIATALAVFAVAVVYGASVWLVYGFAQASTSTVERITASAGIVFLTAIIWLNVSMWARMRNGSLLGALDEAWLSWSAVASFVAVLLIVLAMMLAGFIRPLIYRDGGLVVLFYVGHRVQLTLWDAAARNDGRRTPFLTIRPKPVKVDWSIDDE